MKTKYGDISNNTFYFYIDSITGKTYKILPIFEEQSRDKYVIYINDLINELMSLEDIVNSKYFMKLIIGLNDLKTPNPIEEETEHDYVRRKVFEYRNLADKIIKEIKNKSLEGDVIE